MQVNLKVYNIQSRLKIFAGKLADLADFPEDLAGMICVNDMDLNTFVTVILNF